MATNKKPTKTSVVKTNKKPATKPAVKKPTNKKGLIASIKAYEILDSRGFPTIEAFVTTKEGVTAKAMVPSGASTGEREALELRDGDKARYNGKGVLKAIKNVNTYIAKALVGKFSVLDQINIDQAMIALDQKLSKKPNSNFKTFLGANATLSVSMAVMRCAAQLSKKQLYAYIGENFNNNKTGKYVLPVPMLNVINGGAHADNTIDFQEFMYIPAGATSMHQAVQVSSECFHQLAKLLKKDGYNTSKGDEGGFAPLLKDAEQALTYMVKAITEAGYEPYNPNNKVTPKTVGISMDTACSELYDGKNYVFEKAVKANIKTLQQATFSTRQMIDYLELLSQKFPILSIEDGLSENDQNGWKLWTSEDGKKLQIVGDDLYCTNPDIVKKGIAGKWSNSVLIKLNQIGTVSETIETIKLATAAKWSCVVSHRSGETEDTFIADFAVGMGTGQIKTGSMSRSERIAKYNRLLEIENELGKKSVYPGVKAFKK